MGFDLFGLSAATLGGGLAGMLGSLLGRFLGLMEKRDAFRQEQARWAHEREAAELRIRANAAEAEAKLRLADSEGAWDGFEASHRAEAALKSGYAWVEAVRALTRPALTLMLWAALVAMFFRVGAEGRNDLLDGFAQTVTFAATAATLWWFGDRAPKRG